MENIFEFADQRQKAWCVHCAGSLAGAVTNQDHVPSKGLLEEPYPPNLPTIEVCQSCNGAYSLDEQYFQAFLSCVLTGSTEPDAQVDLRAGKTLQRSDTLRARIEGSKRTTNTPLGDEVTWLPEASRLESVIVKNARRYALYELSEPMIASPAHIMISPISKLTPTQRNAFWRVSEPFMIAPWPELGSRMMTRLVSGQDMKDGWIVVQEGTYRYSVEYSSGVSVRTIIREYLATEVVWD